MNSGTIPADILTTKSRQDIVLINRAEKRIFLLKLSCSFEKANIKKKLKILDLKIDLVQAGWKTHLVPFEIESRGQVTKRNKALIYNNALRNQNKVAKELSKISLLLLNFPG